MSKLRYVLLLASLTLLIPSCQNNKANVNNHVVPDGPVEPSQQEDDETSYNLPPIADATFVDVRCEAGYLVKKTGESVFQENYKNYFTNNPAPQTVSFQFSKPSEIIEFPSLVVTVNDDPDLSKQFSYSYSQETGALSFTTNSQYSHIVVEAIADPAIEFDFSNFDGEGEQFSFSATGSIRAIQSGDLIVAASQITDPTQIAIPLSPDADHKAKIRVYGNCNSVSIFQGKINERLSGIKLNHGVTKLDLSMFVGTNTMNLTDLYIGPDVKDVIYPDNFDEMIHEGIYSLHGLEKVVVSKDNPYFDSRNDCGCLIDSSTNTLLLGGAEGFIPEGVTTIAKAAYALNQRLSYVSLPDSLKVIERYAFVDSSMSYLEFSANLKTVEDDAFFHCANLQLADFSRMLSAPNMKANAFRDATILNAPFPTMKPFINNDFNKMNSLIQELMLYDETWGKLGRDFCTLQPSDLPSFVYINKLDPDVENYTEARMDFASNNANFAYSKVVIYDATKYDTEGLYKTWADFEKSEETPNSYYVASFNDEDQTGRFSKWGKRSSYCVLVYSQNDSGEVAELTVNTRDTSSHQPYYNNADTITFAKFFGNYTFRGGDIYEIPDATFMGLRSLKTFEFAPYGGTQTMFGRLSGIGESAFEGTGITSIKLPNDVINIGDRAFADCPNLKEFDFGFHTNNNDKLNINGYVFINDVSLASIHIPVFVNIPVSGGDRTVINPFTGCTGLEKITAASKDEGDPTLIIDDYGNLFHGPSNRVIACVNSFATGKLPREGYNISSGFYTTLKSSYVVANLSLYSSWDRHVTDYMLNGLKAKTLALVGETKTTEEYPMMPDYMFANCKNLELLDLSQLNSRLYSKNPDNLFDGVETEFMIKVKAKELSHYMDVFALPQTRFIPVG